MSIATLCKALDDAIGENSADASVSRWIDTGQPELNRIMSGDPTKGLPQGRLIEIFGEASTGKTAIATDVMSSAQAQGGVAGFMDWERSFNIDLAKTFGLKDERPHWIYKKPKTWEEGNTLAAKAIKLIREAKIIADDAPIVFVFDSIASALPKSMLDKDMDEYNMNDTTALARVTSTTLKVMAQVAEEYDATLIYLNQMRLKPGVVYGDPRTTPGGKAMEFYSSVRLALGREKIVEGKGADKEFVGQKIGIQCVKSKFTKPFQQTSLRLMFDDAGVASFDLTTSLIEIAVEKGLLKYSKPRVTWTDGKQYFVKDLAKKINAEGAQSELKEFFLEPAVV